MDASSLNWILPLCLIPVFFLFLVIMGGIAYLALKSGKEAKEYPAHFEKATPGTGKVIEVGDSESSRDGDVFVALRLEVTPAGGAPYPVISLWYIKPTHQKDVQPGSVLDIMIDRENPRVIYPAKHLRWARQPIWQHEYGEERFRRKVRLDKKTQARIDIAIPASARIVEVGNSYASTTVGSTSVAMRLEVTPPAGAGYPGGTPYPVISVWEVQPTQASEMRAGKVLNVRIDAQNPQVIYSGEPWATQTYTKEYTQADMEN
jgi:hypothetical protein